MSVNSRKGSGFESLLERYLHEKGFVHAYRPRLKGALDEGDINGIERQQYPDGIATMGGNVYRHVVIQAKNARKWELGPWLNETVDQAKNHTSKWRAKFGPDSLSGVLEALGVLVVKRPGKGKAEDQYAVMKLGDLVTLLKEAGYK